MSGTYARRQTRQTCLENPVSRIESGLTRKVCLVCLLWSQNDH
jgi:hypothetical protein